jgi:hypothetical protein
MRTSPLAWLVLAGILFFASFAPGQDRVVSPLMCGANQGFNVAGIYYGTMPPSNPASRRADFIKILNDKEIHALRFPGGTLANVYRFNEGRFLISSLLVRENLGKHPAADRLLLNMLRWAAAGTAKPLAPLPADFDQQLKAIGYLNP